MIRYRAIRELYEGRLAETSDPYAGRRAFLRDWYETLGLASGDRSAPEYVLAESGQPCFGEARAKPSEVSIRHLADAIIGHETVDELFHPASGVGASDLLEAAIDPTSFLNVNTFNLAVAGLVNAQILEKFQDPAYIGDRMCTVVPTTKNGDKLIGAQRIGPQTAAGKGRQPGEQHPTVGFGERYQTTPETVEQALKCMVTREVVFFDLTGQVLDSAGGVGDELGYGREKSIADGVQGVTSSYNYGGTLYGTYQTASPFINDQSNQLLDYTSVDSAIQLGNQMTDPDTGKEVLIQYTGVLVAPFRVMRASKIFRDSMVFEGTNLTGNFPARYAEGPNPINLIAPQLAAGLVSSQIWYNRLTAADGLNLAASAAREYWWMGDFRRAFEWRENWPLTPWQASATEYVMKDQGLIAVYGANYRGVFNVREPRRSIRNKN